VLTAKGVIEDFAQDLSWDMKNTMVATQAPIQGAILATKITKAAWHTKPSWFVIADNDRMIRPDSTRRIGAVPNGQLHAGWYAGTRDSPDGIGINAKCSTRCLESDFLS
jgi:hypothetical protein